MKAIRAQITYAGEIKLSCCSQFSFKQTTAENWKKILYLICVLALLLLTSIITAKIKHIFVDEKQQCQQSCRYSPLPKSLLSRTECCRETMAQQNSQYCSYEKQEHAQERYKTSKKCFETTVIHHAHDLSLAQICNIKTSTGIQADDLVKPSHILIDGVLLMLKGIHTYN